MERHCSLISCKDETGLIYRISKVFSDAGANITENLEFVDRVSSTFFMRTEITGTIDKEKVLGLLKSNLPKDSSIEIRKQEPKRLVVFTSDEPHCLGDLLLRHSFGQVNGVIHAVVSQVDHCRDLCKRFEIPFIHVPVKKGMTREDHEAEILKVVAPFSPDFLILARYMRILTSGFVSRFPSRIINIHHSFLPAFIGKNPYEQAFERGVKIIGATAHFVNDVLDDGPIITQAVIPIDHTQDPVQLAKLGQDVERLVLAQAVELVLNDRVMVQGRRTIILK